MSDGKPRVLLLGDTILNLSYLARPLREGEWHYPYSYFNEEYLETEDEPDASLQGIAYIAEYLGETGDETLKPIVCTGYPRDKGLAYLRADMERHCTRVLFVEGNYQPPVVVRVFRDVTSSHFGGTEPQWPRPVLRIDRPPLATPMDDRAADLVQHVKSEVGNLSRKSTSFCMFRSTLPGFFGIGKNSSTNELLEILACSDTQPIPVVDLRPIPQDLRIFDPRTLISSTTSRLRKLVEEPDRAELDTRTVIEKAFWRLAPARALICYAAREGVMLCVRREPYEAHFHHFSLPKSARFTDNPGLVTGGDAFLAAFLHTLTRATGTEPSENDLVTAAQSAISALLLSMTQAEVGFRPSSHEVENGVQVQAKKETIYDRDNDLLVKMLAAVAAEPVFDADIIRPEGGALDEHLKALEDELGAWTRRKGRDLIAIFGESRSGKEYPLKRLLGRHGYERVGPVNMQRFLVETEDILTELTQGDNPKRVLLLDEIIEESAARPLLNLMAEKKYRSYHPEREDIDFKKHMIIIMSSMEKERLLPDLRGRLRRHLVNPPLRERADEIPYLIPICLKSGLDDRWDEPETFKVSLRLLSVLLRHDYRSIDSPLTDEEAKAGMGQMNFRALEDLLTFMYKQCPEDDRFLKFGHLPERLRKLLFNSAPDEESLTYTRREDGRYHLSHSKS